ncbi:unnamed protein product [Ilex paraguariensis]|uniref:Uncharacterized protein n=1 Tax=Ilex paraguariensis TaxID=185542 RepID=A0ABC8UX88_9AQUA
MASHHNANPWHGSSRPQPITMHEIIYVVANDKFTPSTYHICKQKHWFSTAMDVEKWFKSGSGNHSECDYDRFLQFNLPPGTVSKAPIWRLLWRKLKKEKKRFFDRSSSVQYFTYDPYTYALNFDQGLKWADSDDLSRSFSARFSVPSRIFQQNG